MQWACFLSHLTPLGAKRSCCLSHVSLPGPNRGCLLSHITPLEVSGGCPLCRMPSLTPPLLVSLVARIALTKEHRRSYGQGLDCHLQPKERYSCVTIVPAVSPDSWQWECGSAPHWRIGSPLLPARGGMCCSPLRPGSLVIIMVLLSSLGALLRPISCPAPH
jgi:hypothetical protein